MVCALFLVIYIYSLSLYRKGVARKESACIALMCYIIICDLVAFKLYSVQELLYHMTRKPFFFVCIGLR